MIVAIEAGIGFPLGESWETSGFPRLKFGILSCTNGFLVSDILARETFIVDLCLFKNVVTLLGASCQMVKLYPRVYCNSRSFRGTTI